MLKIIKELFFWVPYISFQQNALSKNGFCELSTTGPPNELKLRGSSHQNCWLSIIYDGMKGSPNKVHKNKWVWKCLNQNWQVQLNLLNLYKFTNGGPVPLLNFLLLTIFLLHAPCIGNTHNTVKQKQIIGSRPLDLDFPVLYQNITKIRLKKFMWILSYIMHVVFFPCLGSSIKTSPILLKFMSFSESIFKEPLLS